MQAFEEWRRGRKRWPGQSDGGHDGSENQREALVPGAASSDAGVKWLDMILFLKQEAHA